MFARVLHVMLFSTCVTQVTTVVLMCLIIETMWRSERRSGRYRHNNITPPEIAVPLGISARSATLTEEPSENAPLQSRFGSLESVFLSGPSGSSKKTKTLDVGAELRREEVAQQVVAKKETDDMITLTTEIDGLEDKMRELSALAERDPVQVVLKE